MNIIFNITKFLVKRIHTHRAYNAKKRILTKQSQSATQTSVTGVREEKLIEKYSANKLLAINPNKQFHHYIQNSKQSIKAIQTRDNIRMQRLMNATQYMTSKGYIERIFMGIGENNYTLQQTFPFVASSLR